MSVKTKRRVVTIDEKIDALVDWIKKYPKLRPSSQKNVDEEILSEYAKTEEEAKTIREEYKKIQSFYEYYRVRRKMLTAEQIQRGKEGRVGGVFGYPDDIMELSTRYNIDSKKIDNILIQYGSIEQFLEAYFNGEITGENLKIANVMEEKTDYLIKRYGGLEQLKRAYFSGKLTDTENENAQTIIKDCVDIDFNVNSINYDFLARAILEHSESDKNIMIYSSNEIKETLETLNPREKQVLIDRFGLNDGQFHTLNEISGKFGVGLERVRQIESKALGKLRYKSGSSMHNHIKYNLTEKLTDLAYVDEKEKIEKFEKLLMTSTVLDRNQGDLQTTQLTEEQKQELIEGIKLIKDIYMEKTIREERTKIKEPLNEWNVGSCCFTNNTHEFLIAEGCETVQDIKKLLEGDLSQKLILREDIEEILDVFTKVGIKVDIDRSILEGLKSREDIENRENISTDYVNITIDELGMSVRTYNCLKRAGINTVLDLVNKTEKEMRMIKNLGKNTLDEILNKLESMGLGLKDEEVYDDTFTTEMDLGTYKESEEGDDYTQSEETEEGDNYTQPERIKRESDVKLDDKQDEELTLEELGIYWRALAELDYLGIKKVEDFANMTEEELKKILFFSNKALNIVKKQLALRGLKFKDNNDFEQMDFSVRTHNALKYNGEIDTIEDLVDKTADDLMKISGFGIKGLKEVRYKLALLGLSLKGESMHKLEDDANNQNNKLLTPIDELNLLGKTSYFLHKAGIYKVLDLVNKTKSELMQVEGCGKTSKGLKDIIRILNSMGLRLREEGEPLLSLDEEKSEKEENESQGISKLGLAKHVLDKLYIAGITSVQDLINLTKDELWKKTHFNYYTIKSIEENLSSHGLKLREKDEGKNDSLDAEIHIDTDKTNEEIDAKSDEDDETEVVEEDTETKEENKTDEKQYSLSELVDFIGICDEKSIRNENRMENIKKQREENIQKIAEFNQQVAEIMAGRLTQDLQATVKSLLKQREELSAFNKELNRTLEQVQQAERKIKEERDKWHTMFKEMMFREDEENGDGENGNR